MQTRIERVLRPFALLMVVVTSACGTDRAPDPRRRPPVEPTAVETVPAPGEAAARDAGAGGGVGSIHGRVALVGTAPTPPLLRRDQDAFCARTPAHDEGLVVGSAGGIANVAAYLTKAPPPTQPPPAAPLVIDQQACTYRPRVQVARVGQRLEVRTSDPTLHNVHAWRARETFFNQAQIAGAPAITRTLDEAGLTVFKCDVHPWMRAWVVVLPHGWAAVTGEDGTFTLADVPAGSYTLEAWHERLGPKSVPVAVARDQTAEVALSWAAPPPE